MKTTTLNLRKPDDRAILDDELFRYIRRHGSEKKPLAMTKIGEAFYAYKQVNLRRSVNRLIAEGSVTWVGNGPATRYYPTGEPRPEAA